METINQPAAPQTTGKQDNATPRRKGGFVQGAAVAQGCCGETSGSGGCCGAPAQVAVPSTSVQATVQGGCCGASTAKADTTTSSSGCCG